MSLPARPTYLDCDTGIDDSLALAYLLATPAARLVGIGTVSGNTDATQAARNTLDLCGLAGRDDIPVAIGRTDFLARPYDGGAPHVHGANGIGDVELPRSEGPVDARSAAQLLIDLSREHAGELRIVAIGPLTNLAVALEADPTLPERVADITIMGGAALVPGNISPVAEANIGNDPEAAARVIAADWDVTLVPLDVTMANPFEESHRAELLASDSPIARAVGEALDFYFDFYVPEYGRRMSALHDPLAAAISTGGVIPSLAPRVPVSVDATDGPGRGQTIADLRGQRVAPRDHDGVRTRVVLEAEGDVARHLVDLVTARA
ncbi:nucleoside hydrolase [Microbacterium indicum]|uniref:nucleoside hydrolase n=1 Tax=Microbacterium indicum TaxID=358100 RepID=UPI0004137DD2|nr:nucleoside hydrolase [Microbacterium indicum]